MKIAILSVVAVAALAGQAMAGPVVIDGTIGATEWAGATQLTIGNGGGTAWIKADTNFIYGAFDITGWTAAMGATTHGNLMGFGAWAANNSYPTGPGVEFQQATSAANWGGGGQTGTMNSLASAWRLNGQAPEASFGAGLQAADSFATGHRVWEVKMPISHLGKSAGDTVWVVGGINFGGVTHWYPDTFFPGYNGYAGITVQGNLIPLPTGAGLGLAGLAVMGFRRRSA